MSREQPLDPPPTERVRDAASTVLDRSVDAISPISEGLNAVYRLRMADGEQTVLKLGTLDTDEVLLVEPGNLARASRLGSAGYFSQFAREETEAAVTQRWCDRIRTLAASLDDETSVTASPWLGHEEQ